MILRWTLILLSLYIADSIRVTAGESRILSSHVNFVV